MSSSKWWVRVGEVWSDDDHRDHCSDEFMAGWVRPSNRHARWHSRRGIAKCWMAKAEQAALTRVLRENREHRKQDYDGSVRRVAVSVDVRNVCSDVLPPVVPAWNDHMVGHLTDGTAPCLLAQAQAAALKFEVRSAMRSGAGWGDFYE